MDYLKEYWENNPEELNEVCSDILEDIDVLKKSLIRFKRNPSIKNANRYSQAYEVLYDALNDIDTPIRREEERSTVKDNLLPGQPIYISSQGSVEPYKVPTSLKKAAIEDEVADLLALHRTEIWRVDSQVLSAIKDPTVLLLSHQQMEVISKARLMIPLSRIDTILVNCHDLFSVDVDVIAKRHKTTRANVIKARAISLGLSMRGDY